MFFGKKRIDPENVHVEEKAEDDKPAAAPSGAAGQVGIELTKINAQIDSLKEMRKGIGDRLNQMSEQMGQLRGQIADTNKSVSLIEVKSTKAVDLVDSVQPDKMMISLQKMDSKIEALRASLESGETRMKTILDEMRDVRLKMGVFKGLDSVQKLNDDTKSQLTNITKVNATIERHADKVESIYSEFQKSFNDFRSLSDNYKSLTKQFKDISTNFDQVKVKLDGAASKKELENMITKYTEFEKKVGALVELLDKHANDLPIYLEDKFKKWEERIDKRFDKMKAIFKSAEDFEKRYPKLAKELKVPEAKEEAEIPKIPAELPKLGEKGPGDKPSLLSKILPGKKDAAPPAAEKK